MPHDLSLQVKHSKGWRSCTLSFVSDFVAKTQNPSVYSSHSEEFVIPPLADFVDGDGQDFLCPIRAVKRYLSRQNSSGLCALGCLVQLLRRRRNVCPKTPFRFVFNSDFPCIGIDH